MVNAGISGADIQDMMKAVEARFGGVRATQPVEVLSDNGSPCTARDTRVFAAQLGLRTCFTPVRSRQSNGVSDAFVDQACGVGRLTRGRGPARRSG